MPDRPGYRPRGYNPYQYSPHTGESTSAQAGAHYWATQQAARALERRHQDEADARETDQLLEGIRRGQLELPDGGRRLAEINRELEQLENDDNQTEDDKATLRRPLLVKRRQQLRNARPKAMRSPEEEWNENTFETDVGGRRVRMQRVPRAGGGFEFKEIGSAAKADKETADRRVRIAQLRNGLAKEFTGYKSRLAGQQDPATLRPYTPAQIEEMAQAEWEREYAPRQAALDQLEGASPRPPVRPGWTHKLNWNGSTWVHPDGSKWDQEQNAWVSPKTGRLERWNADEGKWDIEAPATPAVPGDLTPAGRAALSGAGWRAGMGGGGVIPTTRGAVGPAAPAPPPAGAPAPAPPAPLAPIPLRLGGRHPDAPTATPGRVVTAPGAPAASIGWQPQAPMELAPATPGSAAPPQATQPPVQPPSTPVPTALPGAGVPPQPPGTDPVGRAIAAARSGDVRAQQVLDRKGIRWQQ